MPHRKITWMCALLAAGCGAHTAAPRSPAALEAASTALPTRVLESNTALMPRAVTSFGAAALDGAVYAFGGYSGVPHAYNREGQSGALVRLDPDTRTFTELASSEPVQGAALVSSGNAIVRIGGMRAKNAVGEPDDISSLDEVAAYVPAVGRWSELPGLPTPRSSHAAATIGSTIYVVGGWQLRGSAKTGTFANELLAFDVGSKTYRNFPQPFARRALAAAAVDEKLVVLGGISPDGAFSREVHVFDPVTAAWSRAADFPADAFGAAATSDGDTLIASALDGTLYALSEVNGAWRTVGRLALPRFFHQLVQVSATRVLALGGISGMHTGPRIREVESIDLTRPSPRALSFTISNPLSARNRQGAFVHGDSLYVFGGNRSLEQHDFQPEHFTREAARLDIASMSWSTVAPYPAARQTVQTLLEDDRALALGGFGHDGQQARAHADAFTYDVRANAWSPDASVLLPLPVVSPTSTFLAVKAQAIPIR